MKISDTPFFIITLPFLWEGKSETPFAFRKFRKLRVGGGGFEVKKVTFTD